MRRASLPLVLPAATNSASSMRRKAITNKRCWKPNWGKSVAFSGERKIPQPPLLSFLAFWSQHFAYGAWRPLHTAAINGGGKCSIAGSHLSLPSSHMYLAEARSPRSSANKRITTQHGPIHLSIGELVRQRFLPLTAESSLGYTPLPSSRAWRNGRRNGLKIRRAKARAGSSPAARTRLR